MWFFSIESTWRTRHVMSPLTMEKVVTVNAQMAEYLWGRGVKQENTKRAWRHAQVCNIIFSYYQNLYCLLHYTNIHFNCIYFLIWWNRRKNKSAIRRIERLYIRGYDENLEHFGVLSDYPRLDVYIIISEHFSGKWVIQFFFTLKHSRMIPYALINIHVTWHILNLHQVIGDINLFMI